MGNKRLIHEVDASPLDSPYQQSKRKKQTSPQDDQTIGSESSVSFASSAPRSTPTTSHRTRHSSQSSVEQPDLESKENDSESSISTSSSSSSSSSDSESEEEIVTVRGSKKPRIDLDDQVTAGATALQSRLAALLPQLAEANQQLASDPVGSNMEDIEDGEAHIEMDLGLGVLEEQNDGDDTSDSSESSDEDERGDDEDDEGVSDTPCTKAQSRKRPYGDREKDVLGRLMRHEHTRKKVKIEDLE